MNKYVKAEDELIGKAHKSCLYHKVILCSPAHPTRRSSILEMTYTGAKKGRQDAFGATTCPLGQILSTELRHFCFSSYTNHHSTTLVSDTHFHR